MSSQQRDQELLKETFDTVIIRQPKPWTTKLSNGETIGQYLYRAGRNEENQDIYDQWISLTVVKKCKEEFKKNYPEEIPEIMFNGLEKNTNSLAIATEFFATQRKQAKKKKKSKTEIFQQTIQPNLKKPKGLSLKTKQLQQQKQQNSSPPAPPTTPTPPTTPRKNNEAKSSPRSAPDSPRELEDNEEYFHPSFHDEENQPFKDSFNSFVRGYSNQ